MPLRPIDLCFVRLYRSSGARDEKRHFMNALLDRADIGTHVKIVIVGLIAAIVIVVIGIQAHLS